MSHRLAINAPWKQLWTVADSTTKDGAGQEKPAPQLKAKQASYTSGVAVCSVLTLGRIGRDEPQPRYSVGILHR